MPDRFNDGLDLGQSFALLNEAQSAQNLLRDTVDATLHLRHPTLQGDAVFTLGSIGVEKLMKVVLGLVHLRDHGEWPSVKTMKGWGHGVLEMNDLVMATIEANIHQATHSPYVQQLVDSLKGDIQWPLLVATFNRYGLSGRFYYLDHLAQGRPSDWEAPIEFWNRLEQSVTDARPEILSLILSSDRGESERGYALLSHASAKSLNNWWHLVYRAAIQGCFGERGKTIGFEIWPLGQKQIS